MQVDIYIKEVDGTRSIRIPWLPDEIQYGTGEASMASYEIMGKGEVVIPTGVGLATCSWESIFPGMYRTDRSLMRGSWKKPESYQKTLVDWKKKKTKLNLLVVGYPINLCVYLADFQTVASGAFGDIAYTVSFKEARSISVTAITTGKSSKNVISNALRTVRENASYTIKSGDTLWSIAKSQLGSGSRWTEIYRENKSVIESTAIERWKAAGKNCGSENGRWIFPGTTLRIPSK